MSEDLLNKTWNRGFIVGIVFTVLVFAFIDNAHAAVRPPVTRAVERYVAHKSGPKFVARAACRKRPHKRWSCSVTIRERGTKEHHYGTATARRSGNRWKVHYKIQR